MKKALFGTAVLIAGLFLFCTKVFACEKNYILPKAGFQRWESQLRFTKAVTYVLTDEEKELLLKVGVLEGGETDPQAIEEVMQVVLNRVESDQFPDSVEEVIFQKKQFASSRRLDKANITDEAYEALYAVIMGENLTNEALYFESLDGIVWGKCHEYLFTYGGHDFYK